MKLLRLNVTEANTCGGLLNGVQITFRTDPFNDEEFEPLCLIGPNGAGKSQLLQIIAEIFQAVYATHLPQEEQGVANKDILFELEYLIKNKLGETDKIKIYRRQEGKRITPITIEKLINSNWEKLEDNSEIATALPSKVIGYTSGGNETLSIPFYVSRAGYAKQVRTNALDKRLISDRIPDSRMLLIDYSTNLEVLIANLLLNPDNVRKHLIKQPGLEMLRSFRCVIQLKNGSSAKNEIKLTKELQQYIDYLKFCATSYSYNKKEQSYIFDFFIQNATHQAFKHYWKGGAFELYSCFHKLAMLNDLVIPKQDRDAFNKGIEQRRFASRLPEPMERQKVFRFERVEFRSQKDKSTVDYVSLSDGEHQLTQLLGTFCMVSDPNALFLLDEPESHFNPKWRVEFISKILNLPTTAKEIKSKKEGRRSEKSAASNQDCVITTHSPFVPSDMKSDNVFIFSKEDSGEVKVRNPNIQTFGSNFNTILGECFGISPPISDIPKLEIENLMKSENIDEIRNAMEFLGDSVERMYLADRIRMLKSKRN